MVSEELKSKLNDAIARELQVSIQYMWQHVKLETNDDPRLLTIKKSLRAIAITEMKHAEVIAERLVELGGEPTVDPDKIVVGDSIEEMIRKDTLDEEGAVKMYREIIEMAKKEGDEKTANLFQGILADEEGHLEFFKSVLGGDNSD